ncbi:MAG: type II secretion system F family protein [Actinomycetota bacterium]|nr:type II secretion system F family protein [Actinomycetota bacterium]
MLSVVTILTFGVVVVCVYVVLSTVLSEELQVTRRLRRMTDYEATQAKQVEPLLRPFGDRILSPIAARLRDFGTAITPHGYSESVKHKLVLAGSPNGIDSGRFMAIKVLASLGIAGLFIGVSVLRPFGPAAWIVGVLPLTLAIFVVPDIWLSSRVSARRSAIRRALPDMLDMLTISVEAGLGFDQAMAKLVRNTTGPLSEEFGRVLQEVQAGVKRSDAMRRLAQRTEVPELNGFIMAIVQADVFGISVSGVLRSQATEMRVKRRQYAEEAAQKAPVKLVFPLVICILPATLIVILGPAVISFVKVFG